MPIWLQDNMLSTIRYFNRFISMQSAECCYLLFRRWSGDMVSNTVTSYRYNTYYKCYEFDLYTPTNPPSGGKPRLPSIRIFLDGEEMVPVPSFNDVTSENQFWCEVGKGTPKSKEGEGNIIIGFKPGFDPRSHIVTYIYEEVCHCIEAEEQNFHPLSTCTTCYGTGYVGGYTQYTCPPLIEGGRVIRPANTILVRFPLASETARVGKYGIEVRTQRKSWAVVSPLLHDWDVIVRPRAFGAPYNIDPTTLAIPDERYAVVEWEHSSTRASYSLPLKEQPGAYAVDKGVTLHQKFILNEYQPAHIIYQVPITT